MIESPARLLCVGVVAAVHGIRGQVKIKSFTAEPSDIFTYGVLSDSAGNARYTLKPCGLSGSTLLATIDGIGTREAAEDLKGTKFYIDRDALPETSEDEFYIEDLIGLTACSPDGAIFGKITSIENYGAGDLIEITTPDGETELFAFTYEIFPEIDVAAGKVIIELPEIIEDEEPEV
jgi:16S rRNA processing protein RimM